MNFKKQVMRYRLKADQKIGRANKSEVLNEELLQIERRLDHTRTACMSVYKRISQCQLSSGADLDRRMKKLPETAVANAMLDASHQLGIDSESALQKSLKVCGEAQSSIAKERAIYEMFVEGHVITPLHTLVETDIPNIQKLRDRLKKLVLDRDNAYAQWQKANKAQYNPGVNLQQMSVKADSMRDELDGATSRMEQCKDQLITELYDFIAKEGTYAQHVTDFVEKELEYHKRCVAHLENLKPDLESAKAYARSNSSYGTSLADHLRVTEHEIALPIESCIACLLEIGIYEEGLFRIAGGAAKMKKFRALAGAGVMDLLSYDAHEDIHAVAGTLKHYLRELPDPLLTQNLYHEWVAVTSITNNDDKLRDIWSLIDRLPKANKDNLGYLMRFCHALASKSEYNKMNASNIALVLSPNLLWPPNDDITTTMMVSNSVAGLVESMITYVDYFFPDVPEFKVPPPPIQMDKTANLGHGRTPSSGSMGDGHGVGITSPNTNTPPQQPRGSPSHSRNSSSETSTVMNHAQGENTIQRAKKKKAPPAPTQAPPTHTNASRSNSIAADGSKPPVATKRMTTKRPSMPPPARPQTGDQHASDSKMSVSDSPSKPATASNVTSLPAGAPSKPVPASNTPSKPVAGPKPAPKPRIPTRKQPPRADGSTSPRRPPLSNIDFNNSTTAHDELSAPIREVEEVTDSGVGDSSPADGPPMPDFPPPPPPSTNDACGPDLSTELASAPVVETTEKDDDDEDCLMTQL